MEAAQNLSNNLRALRATQGCSLVRYAQLLNISKSTLQEIERGHPPHLETVECIARSLGVPVSALLSDNLTAQVDPAARLLLQLDWCASWSPEDRELLLGLCLQLAQLFHKYVPRADLPPQPPL